MSDNPWATSTAYRPMPLASERLKVADVWAAVVTTAVVVLLGAPVGVLWGAVAPRAAAVKVAQGAHGIFPQVAETKDYLAADWTFLIIALLVGLGCGIAAALIGGSRAPGVAIGLALGGVLAAVIAMKVGHRIGYDSYAQLRDAAKVGSRGRDELKLRLRGVLFAWPAAASLALLTVTAGRRPAPAQPPVA
ncbi:MAG: hypothetical protein QOJ92_209 [Frankiales bacterium]|nr:hypothetical protein [Frankiales bacterium]